MRRKDRKLDSENETMMILQEGKTIQLAFVDGEEPYIVTMNYGYEQGSSGLRIYFHSALEGRKIDCLKRNPHVCFTVVLCDNFVAGEKACNYGMKYRSVVGTGTLRIVEDSVERKKGLDLLMEHCTGKRNWEYEEQMLARTLVLCLEVKEFSGKQKK